MKLFRGAVLLVAVIAGCGTKEEPLPDSLPALRDVAARDRDAAKAARGAKDVKKADAAAAHAEAASKKAGELLAKNAGASDEDKKARGECGGAALEARRQARFAAEEKHIEEVRGSLKGKAYRLARKAAWGATCQGMAAAADQANGRDLETLPQQVRESALRAGDLAARCCGRKPLADGKPDWPGIASDMRGMSGAMPWEACRDMAIALALLGKNEMALWEIETIDPWKLATDDERTGWFVAHGVILSRLGCPLLAAEEIEKAPALAGSGYGPEILAGVHLALAFVYLQSKDNEAADREIGLSMQAWPGNPVAVYLTGERLEANGEHEKAAECLEEASKGTEGEWLAKRLAQRARDVRDHPGESPSLVHDPEFQREVVFQYLAVAAKKSPAAAKLNAAIIGAEGMARAMLEHVPGN